MVGVGPSFGCCRQHLRLDWFGGLSSLLFHFKNLNLKQQI